MIKKQNNFKVIIAFLQFFSKSEMKRDISKYCDFESVARFLHKCHVYSEKITYVVWEGENVHSVWNIRMSI